MRKTIIIETLFRAEETNNKPRTIKFTQIKAVFETLVIREDKYLNTYASVDKA